MTDPPTVSVVAVFYNDEEFLKEAIDSVLAQTYADWELLLVDDGSTDGSTAVAHRAAMDDSERISYLDHEGHANRGISATRNLGVAQARGRYVAFLDSDDVWNPEKLEEQVAILDAHPDVGLLFGASLYWWSWAGHDARADAVKRIGAEQDRVHRPPSLLLKLYPLGKGVAPCPSSCIARRDMVQRIGGFAEEFRTMYEDQTFLTRAYLSTDVFVSGRCWDRYRRHERAITLTITEQEYRAVRARFLRWLEGQLKARDVEDPRVHAALRRAWWPLHHPHLAAVRRRAGTARATLLRHFASRSRG